MELLTIEKGRKLVIAVFFAYILIQISGLLVAILYRAPLLSPYALARYVIMITLCVLMWRGIGWARFLLILKGIISLLFSPWAMYMFLQIPASYGFVIELFGVLFEGFATAVLLFSSSVPQFIMYKKTKRLRVVEQQSQ